MAITLCLKGSSLDAIFTGIKSDTSKMMIKGNVRDALPGIINPKKVVKIIAPNHWLKIILVITQYTFLQFTRRLKILLFKSFPTQLSHKDVKIDYKYCTSF